MKKQLFTLFALLAMFLVGNNAMAQTEGLTPASALEVVVGSVTRLTFTDDGTNKPTNYTWTVGEVVKATGLEGAITATDVSASWQFVTDFTDFTTPAAGDLDDEDNYILWQDVPTGLAGVNVYVVEVTGTTAAPASCSTRRRVFVTVFDFEVDMFISDINGVSVETTPAEMTKCNTWSDRVIYNGPDVDNPFEGAAINAPNSAYTAEDGDGLTGVTKKVTTTYFAVAMSLTGNTNTHLANMKWRMKFSMPGFTDASILSIQLVSVENQIGGAGTPIVGADVEFADEGGENYLGEDYVANVNSTGELTAADYDVPTALANLAMATGTAENNNIYFPSLPAGTPSQALYIFRVVTHNNLGDNDMAFDVRADRVEVEVRGADTYTDGSKINTAVAALYTAASSSYVALADGTSGLVTINQSPAISTIKIAQ